MIDISNQFRQPIEKQDRRRRMASRLQGRPRHSSSRGPAGVEAAPPADLLSAAGLHGQHLPRVSAMPSVYSQGARIHASPDRPVAVDQHRPARASVPLPAPRPSCLQRLDGRTRAGLAAAAGISTAGGILRALSSSEAGAAMRVIGGLIGRAQIPACHRACAAGGASNPALDASAASPAAVPQTAPSLRQSAWRL